MGVRDCAFDGCNALEFRTSEYCLRHNALFLVSNKKRRAEWRRRTREKNKQRWEKRKPRLRELADSVFASVSNFVVDLDTGKLEFSADGGKWSHEKSLSRQYRTIEAEMLRNKENKRQAEKRRAERNERKKHRAERRRRTREKNKQRWEKKKGKTEGIGRFGVCLCEQL